MNAWSDFDLDERAPKRAGFTLIELLVVILVVSLLAALARPAFAGSKGRTKIGQCASNLKQFGLAMQAYASDHNDKLPVGFGGGWAFDLSWAVGDSISPYGATRAILYCPGTAPRFTETDNLGLYNFAVSNFHVIGYATTFPGTPGVAPTNSNSTLIPTSSSVSEVRVPPPIPAERVLLADATISYSGQNDPSQRFSYNYTSINGGFAKQHLSPHLIGRFPIGGNVAMLDGHIDWRPFNEMFPERWEARQCSGGEWDAGRLFGLDECEISSPTAGLQSGRTGPLGLQASRTKPGCS